MTENKVDTVQTILKDLGDIDFRSFFRDFCYVLGCETDIGFGDEEEVGDLVIKQSLPFPQTVEVLDRREAALEESEVQNNIEERPEDSNLLIVTHTRPSDAVLSLAKKDRISIIGTRDIAHAILDMEAVDLLAARLQEDGDLLEEHAMKLESLEYGPFPEYSSAHDDKLPSVSTPFFDLKLLGYDFVESQTLSTSGMIVAMEIQSKRDDIDIKSTCFTYHDANKYTYSGISRDSKKTSSKFSGLLEGALPSQWIKSDSFIYLSVSGGGRGKFIQYFPCETSKPLSKIRYRADKLRHIFQISDHEIEDYYDVTDSWDEFACQITVEGNQRTRLCELPEDVNTALDSIQ
jgi:hypothetical protein